MSSTLDAIAMSLHNIPKEQIYLFCLEKHDQNYDAYIDMMSKLDLTPELSKRKFLSLKKRTSASFENTIPNFSKKELEEFRNQISLYNKRYSELINCYSD